MVRSGAPSLPPLSPPSSFSLFYFLFPAPRPPLFSTSPSSLSVTFWHVLPSVYPVCPDIGRSQVAPSATAQTHANGKDGMQKRKKKKWQKESRRRFPRYAETNSCGYLETYSLGRPQHKNAEIFAQLLTASWKSKEPAWFLSPA